MKRSIIIRDVLRPFLTNYMNDALDEANISLEDLAQLFKDKGVQKTTPDGKDKGVQKTTPDGEISIRMRWHFDDQERPDGIFIQILEDGKLKIWINLDRPNRNKLMWINSNGSCHVGGNRADPLSSYSARMLLIGRVLFRDFFVKGKESHQDSIEFNPQKLTDRECVVQYFEGEELDILPDDFIERYFPLEDTCLGKGFGYTHLDDEGLQDKKIQLMKEGDIL